MATDRFLRSAIVGAAALTLLPVALPAWSAPADDVRTAADYFLIQEFELARERVVSLLGAESVQGDDRLQALILKARCDIALAGRSAGTDSFCSVLALRPTWRPPDDETYTRAEWASYQHALDLCGPLVGVVPRVDPLPRDLPLDGVRRLGERGSSRDAPGSRPWFRNPYVLGAAGGLAAGALLLMIEEAPPPPAIQLPNFPDPPE